MALGLKLPGQSSGLGLNPKASGPGLVAGSGDFPPLSSMGGDMWWMPLAQTGVAALGSALGGSGPAGPSNATMRNDQTFDNSGWVVNFGSGDVTTSRQQLPTMGLPEMNTGTMIMLAVGVLVVWKLTRKKSS